MDILLFDSFTVAIDDESLYDKASLFGNYFFHRTRQSILNIIIREIITIGRMFQGIWWWYNIWRRTFILFLFCYRLRQGIFIRITRTIITIRSISNNNRRQSLFWWTIFLSELCSTLFDNDPLCDDIYLSFSLL